MQHNHFRAVLRDGEICGAMRLNAEVALKPWEFLGWRKWQGNHPGDTNTFARGDPELWQSNGQWREDGRQHRFDMVKLDPMVVA